MEADDEFGKLWSQAVQSYISATGHLGGESGPLAAIHDPAELLVQVEKDNDRFSAFREKHLKLRRALKVALQPVVMACGVAGGVIQNSPFAPACMILRAAALLVKSAAGVSEVYDSIEKLLGDLGSFTRRLEQYVQTDINSHLRQNLVSILACLLQILGQSECVIRDGRWKKLGKLLVLGEDTKVRPLFTGLTKLLDEEQRLVGAISYRLCSDIDVKTEKVVGTTMTTLDVVTESNIERRSEAQQALIERHFCTPSFSKNAAIYHEYSDTALKSSGEWLVVEEAFQCWLSRNCRFLFVRGLPGAGKSYLSAIAVGKIKSVHLQGTAHPKPVSVAYFYVKEHDHDLRNLENMLRTVTYQLSIADNDFRSHLLGVLEESDATVTPRRIWANALCGFFGRPGLPNSAMIVLDGLDEAPPQMLKDLFSLLENSAETRISVALFARPEIAEHFRSRFIQDLSQIDIGRKNKGDIAAYVKEHIKQIMVVRLTMQQRGKKAAVDLARDIRSRILVKADDMFFKAALIMNQLYDKETRRSVYTSIEASPPKLDAMIAHAFERLLESDSVDKEDLRELLVWVCVAKVPLTISELYAVLKKRTGRPYDAIEVRLRGKFASIFKLSRESFGSGSYGVENPRAAPARSSTFDLDIDDDGFESGDDEDEEYRIIDTAGTDEGQSVESVFERAPLNAETLKRFQRTEVTFSHSSIRDFLVKGGEADAAKLGLAVDINAAEAHVTHHLLERLRCGSPSKDSSLECDYLIYATLNFFDHFMAIDVDKIPDQEFQSIVQQICQLFLQGDPLKAVIEATQWHSAVNKMLHYLFERPEFSTILRSRWLAAAKDDMCTREELQWIQASVSRRAELFRPLAIRCARLWLNKTGHDDVDYLRDRYQLYLVWVVHCFLEIEKAKDDPKPRVLNIGGFTAGHPPELDEDSLRKLAEFVPMERTVHWYASFGLLLYASQKYSAADSEYRKAIELDADSWPALKGLGLCLKKKKKYEEAMGLLQEALSKVPSTLPDASSIIQHQITDIALCQGDFDTARNLARRFLDANKQDSMMIGLYIRALYGLKDLSGIVSFVRELQDSLPVGQTLDITKLRGVDDEVGRALRSQKALSMIQPAIKATLEPGPEAIDFTTSPWLAAWIAEFMYWFYDDIDDSTRLFERILSPEFREDLRQELKWAYEYPSNSARRHLIRIYYGKAVEAHTSGASPEQWLNKMHDVASGSSTLAAEAGELLGVYLRRYTDTDRSEWKRYFKQGIHEILEMLGSQDLPVMDYADCLPLKLLAAGDMPGAAAAAVFLTASVPDGSLFQTSLLKAGFAGGLYICDGLCSTFWYTYKTAYKALYFCTECRDTAFCDECYPLLKKGTLPFQGCSAKHELVQLLPMPEDMKGVAVVVDGSSVKISTEWLDRLRKEWSQSPDLV